MKNLIFLLTIALFFFEFCFAQTPSEKTGKVVINVVKHLSFTVDPNNVSFKYNQSNSSNPYVTDEDDDSEVTIAANCNWNFTIESAILGNINLVNVRHAADVIPASQFEYWATPYSDQNNLDAGYDVARQLLSSTSQPISGHKNSKFLLNWKANPGFTANLFAGEYKLDIVYKLVEKQ